MEQQKNKAALTRPNAFMASLQNNSALAIAKYSRYSPAVIEEAARQHYKYANRLDSLQRSKQYFTQHCQSPGRETHLQQIEEEIKQCSTQLAQAPRPQSLAELDRLDESGTVKALAILINDLRLYFMVDKVISSEGIMALCPLMITEYGNLTLEEVCVCFAQAKKGHYGELYNKLDGLTLMNWLKQYRIEKMQRLHEQNYVVEAHAKIGLNEGRQDFKGDNAQLVNEAYAVVALEMAAKGKKKKR